jgi:hypothetical protein
MFTLIDLILKAKISRLLVFWMKWILAKMPVQNITFLHCYHGAQIFLPKEAYQIRVGNYFLD